MVVNIDMTGRNRVAANDIPKRNSQVRVLSGDAVKEHGRYLEASHMAMKYKSDLDAAMKALETANAEIDRLVGENLMLEKTVEELKRGLEHMADKSPVQEDRAPKKQSRKSKKEAAAQSEEVPEMACGEL